MKIFLFSAP